MFMAGVFSIIGVAIVYTAEKSPQFLVGKMINSLGLGAALAAGQTYVSEITPTKIRGIALAVYTVCLVCNYNSARVSLHGDHGVSLTWRHTLRASDTSSPHQLHLLALPLWTIPRTRSYLQQSGHGPSY